jgi:serine/threonine protein kinase
MGLRITKSLFDGTYILSFLTVDDKDRLSVTKVFHPGDKEAQDSVGEWFRIFNGVRLANRRTGPGNLLVQARLTRSGAFMVRDYLGETLCDRIDGYPGLAPSEKKWISRQILTAIETLQNNCLFHGDIKPENVLFTKRGFVKLVDHAPFKPRVIGRHQPHYFIHFFSYGRGSAYLAPERLVWSLVDPPDFDELAADLFSAGCVLAYIYTGGQSLFDFSRLIQYADGNKTPLSRLESIDDVEMRELILELVDLNPTVRINAFKKAKNGLFPKWFDSLIEFDISHPLEADGSIDALLSWLDTTAAEMPAGTTDDNIILATLVEASILCKNTLTDTLRLFDVYGSFVCRLASPSLKIARAVSRMISMLDVSDAVLSFRVLARMIEIFDTIDELPAEFAPVGEYYLLPRLVASVERDENWLYHFVSQLPFVVASFSRLWPDLLDLISHEPHFVLSMINPRTTGDRRHATLIPVFLENAAIATEHSPDLFRALYFIASQLLKTPAYIPRIAEFFVRHASRLSHRERRLFVSEFGDPLERAVFSNAISNPALLFPVIAMLHSAGLINPVNLSRIASTALQHLDSGDAFVSFMARSLFRDLPRHYSVFSSATRLAHRNTNQHKTRSPSSSVIYPRASTPVRVSGQVTLRTALIAGSRIAASPVERIAVTSNRRAFAQSNCTHLTEIRVGDEGVRLVEKVDLRDPILGLSKWTGRNVLIAHSSSLALRGAGVTERDDLGFQISAARRLSGQDVAVVTAEGLALRVRDLHARATSWELQSTNRIRQFEHWPSLLGLLLEDGEMLFCDLRVQLPVFARPAHRVQKFWALGKEKMAVMERGGYAVYDLFTKWEPFFRVARAVDYAVPGSDGLLLCDDGGTFWCRPEGDSLALFDRSRGRILRPSRGVLKLPREKELSLHGHTFNVCSGAYDGGLCVTGDVAGYMNFWLPAAEKLDRGRS